MTPKMRDCLAMIRAHFAAHGIPPTYREIAAALGTSPPGALRLVNALVERGHLRKLPGRARALALV